MYYLILEIVCAEQHDKTNKIMTVKILTIKRLIFNVKKNIPNA